MSERKVLNKYYPPDFDPSKIPRMKLPKNRQYTVRLMAPFNMRCKTCGEYIYKGKKFNARKEDVEGDDYLGVRIYRFYIKCTRCLQEISFKTDPKTADYEIEAGATRNFMALKLAEEQAKREEDEKKEEEASNPMKLLENRTEQSKQELELLESLEELKDLNKRQQSINYDAMLSQFDTREACEKRMKMQEEEDERLVKSIFSKKIVKEEVIEEIVEKGKIKNENNYDRNLNSDNIDNEEEPPTKKLAKSSDNRNSSIASTSTVNLNESNKVIMKTKAVPLKIKQDPTWNKSVGIISRSSTSGKSLSGLVKLKQSNKVETNKAENSKLIQSNANSEITNKKPAISLVGNYSSDSE